jgi:DNA-directed RNA polymerase specialized sigma24 family protein
MAEVGRELWSDMAECGRRAFHVVDALNAEWNVLLSNSEVTVANWAARHDVLAECRHLGDVLLAIRYEPDAALGALLTEVARNDQLAGRTILQAMLGKLVRMSRGGQQEDVDDFISALWCVLKTYPLATRSRRVAANLALDTLKLVSRERRPSGLHHVDLFPPGELLERIHEKSLRRNSLDHHRHAIDMTAAQLLERARMKGILGVQAEALLISVYADGLTGRAAANRHGISPGSLRARCSKAVKKLAQHAPELWEAA